jgi:DNA-binding MarR family transcriptional regulator
LCAALSYDEEMTETTPAPSPDQRDRLADDLGWGLAVVFRSYVKAADAVTDGLPGGHRGYQVLVAAAREEPRSQAALAQQLGIDRTVMTYLLDDLEAAGLVARQPDPADRRSRRIAATEHGREALADLDTRFAHAEQRLLAGLAPQARATFRRLLHDLAAHVNALDPVATACDALTDLTGRS